MNNIVAIDFNINDNIPKKILKLKKFIQNKRKILISVVLICCIASIALKKFTSKKSASKKEFLKVNEIAILKFFDPKDRKKIQSQYQKLEKQSQKCEIYNEFMEKSYLILSLALQEVLKQLSTPPDDDNVKIHEQQKKEIYYQFFDNDKCIRGQETAQQLLIFKIFYEIHICCYLPFKSFDASICNELSSKIIIMLHIKNFFNIYRSKQNMITLPERILYEIEQGKILFDLMMFLNSVLQKNVPEEIIVNSNFFKDSNKEKFAEAFAIISIL